MIRTISRTYIPTIMMPSEVLRYLLKSQGKTKREICEAFGVRYTEDVPHPIEHVLFGKRMRSHKANRLFR